jgi:TRAP-type mannitol/chloroaromatic compound transport system permease large subunit
MVGAGKRQPGRFGGSGDGPALLFDEVNPLVFGILVALNIQTSFNTPPMAMAAYYLKGVSPPHIRLTQIFGGALPFVSMVFLTMALLYVLPDLALRLPRQLYGR